MRPGLDRIEHSHGQGGFAGARLTDDRGNLAGWNVELDLAHRRILPPPTRYETVRSRMAQEAPAIDTACAGLETTA
jgi:hypothetical protein